MPTRLPVIPNRLSGHARPDRASPPSFADLNHPSFAGLNHPSFAGLNHPSFAGPDRRISLPVRKNAPFCAPTPPSPATYPQNWPYLRTATSFSATYPQNRPILRTAAGFSAAHPQNRPFLRTASPHPKPSPPGSAGLQPSGQKMSVCLHPAALPAPKSRGSHSQRTAPAHPPPPAAAFHHSPTRPIVIPDLTRNPDR